MFCGVRCDSGDGIELSEEGEADRESMDEDSEAAPTDEANCNRVIKLLQGNAFCELR